MPSIFSTAVEDAPRFRVFDETGVNQSVTLSPDITSSAYSVAMNFVTSRLAITPFSTPPQVKVYETAGYTGVTGPTIGSGEFGTNSFISQMKYSPDGTKLAFSFGSVAKNPWFVIYTVSGWVKHNLPATNIDTGTNQPFVFDMEWSHDSLLLAITSTDNAGNEARLHVYNTSTTTPTLVTSKTAACTVYCGGGAFSADDSRFIWGQDSTAGFLKIYDTSTWTTVALPSSLPSTKIISVDWSSDNAYVALSGDTDSNVWVYTTGGSLDATTWTLTQHSVASAPAGLLFGGGDPDVLVYWFTAGGIDPRIATPPTQAVGSHTTMDAVTTGTQTVNAMATMEAPAVTEYTDDVVAATTTTTSVDSTFTVDRSSPVVITSVQTDQLDTNTIETTTITDVLVQQGDYKITAAELTTLRESLDVAFNELLTAATQATATTDEVAVLYAELVEQTLLSTSVDSILQAQTLLAESMALADLSAYFNDEDLSESAAFQTAVDCLHQAYETVTAIMQALGVLDATVHAFVQVSEEVATAALPDSQAELMELLTEVFAPGVIVDIGGESYRVWSVNARTGAPSRYTNYAFNSMAKLGATYLGAGEEGLFELDGSSDDGEPVYAGIKTGKLDFNAPELKRVPNVYVGLTRSGKLMLKTITSRHDGERERWYEMKQLRGGNVQAGGRFELGKGVESRYWQFELVNQTGDDFELDVLDLDVVTLKRRS